MIINNIKIKNFRQYKEVELDLVGNVCDENKKLVVILGENGYGKTTLVRAFLWCLYRENEFQNKCLLNQDVADEMNIGDEKTVRVEINLNHKGKDYRITTKEKYIKDLYGEIVVSVKKNTSIIIDGKPVPPNAVDVEISKILKKDLKDYFFYDGENNKIEAASNKGSLKDAVSQMMGIKKIEQLRDLFNGTYKNSVPQSLRNQLKSDDIELVPVQKKLDELLEIKEKKEELIIENEKEINRLEKDYHSIQKLISANEQVFQDQKKKLELEKEIVFNQSLVDEDFNNMIRTLNDKKSNLFLKMLFAKCYNVYAFDELQEKSSFGSEESLSHISEEAIDQLIKRGKCLCGAIINDGNDAYKHLVESKEHMEPHDFGKYLSDFITSEQSNYLLCLQSEDIIKQSADILLNRIKQIEIDRDSLTHIKKNIENSLDVGYLQTQSNELQSSIDNLIGQNDYIKGTELIDLEEDIKKHREKIEKLSAKTKENDLIKKCIKYSDYIYKCGNKKVKESQEKTKKYLQEEVSEIFDKIYHGDRKICIGDNFEITTLTNNHKLDNSTGTETVKNFAFVAGLLNCIKNHIIKDEESNNSSDVDDNYPLIMDAPFSDIDAVHIKNICSILPDHCDQLCIVVIQKDFDVAFNDIKDRIGKLYRINKHSETYGTIEEVEIDV